MPTYISIYIRPALQQRRIGGCGRLIEENVRCSDTHARHAHVRVRMTCVRTAVCVRACVRVVVRAVRVYAWYPERHGYPSCMISNTARYLSAEPYPTLHGYRTNLFGEERESDVREQHGQEREAQLRIYIAVIWVLTGYSGYSTQDTRGTHTRCPWVLT